MEYYYFDKPTRESTTFQLAEMELLALFANSKWKLIVSWIVCTLTFTLSFLLCALLEWSHLGIFTFAMLVLTQLLHLIFNWRLSHSIDKQLRIRDVKLYNYSIYENQLVVTVKDNKKIFREVIVPRKKIKVTAWGEFLRFSYRGRTYAIPKRALAEDSLFLELTK